MRFWNGPAPIVDVVKLARALSRAFSIRHSLSLRFPTLILRERFRQILQ